MKYYAKGIDKEGKETSFKVFSSGYLLILNNYATIESNALVVSCSHCEIETLILPNAHKVDCFNNNIKTLDLPNIKEISCLKNPIEQVIVNNKKINVSFINEILVEIISEKKTKNGKVTKVNGYNGNMTPFFIAKHGRHFGMAKTEIHAIEESEIKYIRNEVGKSLVLSKVKFLNEINELDFRVITGAERHVYEDFIKENNFKSFTIDLNTAIRTMGYDGYFKNFYEYIT